MAINRQLSTRRTLPPAALNVRGDSQLVSVAQPTSNFVWTFDTPLTTGGGPLRVGLYLTSPIDTIEELDAVQTSPTTFEAASSNPTFATCGWVVSTLGWRTDSNGSAVGTPMLLS